MLKAIEGVQSRVEEKAGATLRKEMKGAFASMNLCGPRVMALPGKETTSLCELFYSYPHLMKSFQEQFKAMLPAAAGRRRRLLAHERGMSTNSKIGNPSSYAAGVLNAVLQKVDKVEKEDQALRKENSEIREQEKQMQQGLKSKGEEINALRKQLSLGSVQGTLKALTSQVARLQPSRRSSCLSDMAKLKFASQEALKEKQEQFCKEYGLDLSDPRIVNVAMVYLGNDWGNKGKDAFLRRLQDGAKFSITDQCTHDKMFSPNDVSIQEIDKMDAPKGTKEWVLLMKLDWANEKGYLASQLQDSKDDNKCRKLDYLPHTEIGLQVYEDKEKCCEDSKDFWACTAKGCSLERVDHHWREQPLSFKLSVTGSVFSWKLHEFLLEGTQFTKATKPNRLVMGKNMNGGEAKLPSLLELGSDVDPIPKDVFEAFREHAVATMQSKAAKEILEGVTYDGTAFAFKCGTSKRLCTELTAQSRRVEPLAFVYKEWTFTLKGDGQFVGYEVDEKVKNQRRRLLRFRGGGGS
jgi:hypothetical protein